MGVLLETERLIVRGWELDRDVEDAFAMYGDPEVVRFLGRSPSPVPDVETQREILSKRVAMIAERSDGTGFWALEEKATGQVVGALLVKYLPDGEGVNTEDIEIGWHLRRSAWGKGYATEAARAGVRYAFEDLGLPMLHAVVYAENARSIAVTKRLGMTHVGPTNRYYGVTVEHFELRKP